MPAGFHHLLRAGAATALLAVTGCASLHGHWPFAHHAAAPQPVAELAVDLPQQGTPPVVLQYWERNTLVVDLTSVAGQGAITLRPGEGRGWPARIAFRMAPRRFAELEVRGAQRVVIPVAADAGAPVSAELPPGLYGPGVSGLTVSWGAAGSF